VCRDSHNSNPIKLSELVVLKLLAHSPGYQVSTRSEPPLELLGNVLLTYLSLKSNLNGYQNVR